MNANWITHDDGSIYHLKLRPDQVSPLIITVGDPNRVKKVSRYFDTVDERIQSREFITHVGRLGSKKIMVISTGIGTGNIDIVLNELDALFNIDLITGTKKNPFTPLIIIRIGTSGAIQREISMDSVVISDHCFGMDGLLPFYLQTTEKEKSLLQHFQKLDIPVNYHTRCDPDLLKAFSSATTLTGNTITAPGFYASQGRVTRLESPYKELLQKMIAIELPGIGKLTNIEMETAGIYGLGKALGHRCISINAILANRVNNTFSTVAEETVDQTIQFVLERIENLV
ncbi:MAG: nucleoside phosphorylase [Bacteroidota bacterium]|nr:nucleoside phosphorylase [Bacteroidota bacterium]